MTRNGVENMVDLAESQQVRMDAQLAATRATPLSPTELSDLRAELDAVFCADLDKIPANSAGLTIVLRLLATIDQRDNSIQVAEL